MHRITSSIALTALLLTMPLLAPAGSAGDHVDALTPLDPQPHEGFGWNMRVEHRTLVVSAPRHDLPGAEDAGVVYVFERGKAGWAQTAILAADTPTEGAMFGRDLALDGDRLVVGAPLEPGAGAQSGAAYVFERGNGGWAQTHRLVPDDARPGARFGAGVSIDKRVIAVGAPHDDDLGDRAGALYVFERAKKGWQQTAKLTGSGVGPGHEFARITSVKVLVHTIIAGAWRDDTHGPRAGSVYVFERHAGAWGQVAQLFPADPQAGGLFGNTVAYDGRTLAIGSSRADGDEVDSGLAYVFTRVGRSWVQTDRLEPDTATPFSVFGASLDVHHGRILGGAYGAAAPMANAGAATPFEPDHTAWVATDAFAQDPATATPSQFGWAARLSKDQAFLSAPALVSDGLGTVHVFDL